MRDAKFILAYVQTKPGEWVWRGPLVGDPNGDALVEPLKKAFAIAAGDANPGPIRGLYFTEDQQIIVVRDVEGGPPISDSVDSFPVHVIHPGTDWPEPPKPPRKRRPGSRVPPVPAPPPSVAPATVPKLPGAFVRGYGQIIGNEHLKRAMEVALVGGHTIAFVADDADFSREIHLIPARDVLNIAKNMGLNVTDSVVHLTDDPHPPVSKKIAEADIQVEISPPALRDADRNYGKLNTDALLSLSAQIEKARARLAERPGPWTLDKESERLIERIIQRLKWKPEAIARAVSVARTIAAMDFYYTNKPAGIIEPADLAEAIQYQHFARLHAVENPSKYRLRKVRPEPILTYELTAGGWEWSGTVLKGSRAAELADLLAAEIKNIAESLPASIRRRITRLSITDVDRVQVAVTDSTGRPLAATWKIPNRISAGGKYPPWNVYLVSSDKKPPFGELIEAPGLVDLKWIRTPASWEAQPHVDSPRPARIPAIWYPELDSVVPSRGWFENSDIGWIVKRTNERRKWARGDRTHPYDFGLWGD